MLFLKTVVYYNYVLIVHSKYFTRIPISEQNEDVWKNIRKSDYRIMCLNGTLIPFPEGKDVNFDEKCAFSNGIRAQVTENYSYMA